MAACSSACRDREAILTNTNRSVQNKYFRLCAAPSPLTFMALLGGAGSHHQWFRKDENEDMCGMQAAGRLQQDSGCPRAAGRALPVPPAPHPAVVPPLHWALNCPCPRRSPTRPGLWTAAPTRASPCAPSQSCAPGAAKLSHPIDNNVLYLTDQAKLE